MPDKPPEREIWIEPGQDRATRYWQPIVFQGGVRYILASQVAAEKEKVWKRAIAVAKKSAKATHGKTFDNTSALMIVEALEAARTDDIKEKKDARM